MKKRILSILLLCCMVLTMLPTTAFASVSDSLGNTPEENQAILEQLADLTGGSSDQPNVGNRQTGRACPGP